MTENWYFLVGNDNPDLDRIRIECATQHGRNTTSNELSESLSYDGNARLIKVSGGGHDWQDARNWIGSLRVRPLLQGNETDDLIRASWAQSQISDFDSDNDGTPDTGQQRWQWLRNLFGL
jgi:hypothetical protein